MKRSDFIYGVILSLFLTSQISPIEVDTRDPEKRQPSLRSDNGYERYLAADKEFSVIAAGAKNVVQRGLAMDYIQRFLNDPASAVCWVATKALVVLATNADNAAERSRVFSILLGPLWEEDDSTVSQEAAKGMLILVNNADSLEELQSIRERLTLLLERKNTYRSLCAVAQMFGVLVSKATSLEELRLIARALCSGFLKPCDWRVILEASYVFEAVCKAVASDDEILRMKAMLQESLIGKNDYVCELVNMYWLKDED